MLLLFPDVRCDGKCLKYCQLLKDVTPDESTAQRVACVITFLMILHHLLFYSCIQLTGEVGVDSFLRVLRSC